MFSLNSCIGAIFGGLQTHESARPNTANATGKEVKDDYFDDNQRVKPDPLPEPRLPDPDASPKRSWLCCCPKY